MPGKINIFWFRRDLRLHDNHGLFQALQQKLPVLPVFIFDKNILDDLDNKNDLRVNFIHEQIKQIKKELETFQSSLLVKYGTPHDVFIQLMQEYAVHSVFTNEDYEPYAIARDEEVTKLLKTGNIEFYSFKDQVIFAKNDVMKADGSSYTVYTPYSRKWKEKLESSTIRVYASNKLHMNYYKTKPFRLPELDKMGFHTQQFDFPGKQPSKQLLQNYHATRNYPAIKGTSRLSVHLRFGTISIRQLVKKALESNEVFLNELIWREFYMMILYHYPHVVNHAFKKKYDQIEWLNNEEDFERWKNGTTGFPIVDAGMREMNATGYMHNRVRMIVASFLTKDLLIDWRWGESYFAQKLLDYELSSNNGGWQWAAGSGCDAAPYFRIFNPESQTKKFDPEGAYVQQWIPELDILHYAKPIVDHKFARERALKTYKKALN